MAFFRALESVRPASVRLFADPFAVRFIRRSLRNAVRLASVPPLGRLVDWRTDRRIPGARTSAIARTRFIDDALAESSREGKPQVVILGAGFDCRPYRLGFLTDCVIFEVDHPATLALKLARLREVLPALPKNVTFVETDFDRQTLPAVLASAGFRASLPAVFVWEGVTNYLTAEAVDAVLRCVAACAPGSRVIFTYVHSGVLDGSVPFFGAGRLLRDVAQLGEPWRFGLRPELAPEFLRERELRLECDLSAPEYRGRYFGSAARRMRGYDFYHIALARVP